MIRHTALTVNTEAPSTSYINPLFTSSSKKKVDSNKDVKSVTEDNIKKVIFKVKFKKATGHFR